jgi:hypothetical protein
VSIDKEDHCRLGLKASVTEVRPFRQMQRFVCSEDDAVMAEITLGMERTWGRRMTADGSGCCCCEKEEGCARRQPGRKLARVVESRVMWGVGRVFDSADAELPKPEW